MTTPFISRETLPTNSVHYYGLCILCKYIYHTLLCLFLPF